MIGIYGNHYDTRRYRMHTLLTRRAFLLSFIALQSIWSIPLRGKGRKDVKTKLGCQSWVVSVSCRTTGYLRLRLRSSVGAFREVE